jgi:hypothetical protein
MQSALRIKTTILAGGEIEISDPQLQSGDTVEVIVLLPEAQNITKRSALDILAEAPGRRLFKTAEEVDAYIREERDSWDS